MIRPIVNCSLAGGIFAVLVAVSDPALAKGTETVLHAFAGGTDGFSPEAGLVLDPAGDLYGTTYYGGANYAGTIFKVAPDGTESKLYDFDTTQGAYPESPLIIDSGGNLVGTTYVGGNVSDCTSGCGVIFTTKPTGSTKVNFAFTGKGGDGKNPVGGVIEEQGTFYGTTFQGGASNAGTAYALTKHGAETVLFSFGGDPGGYPTATLIKDKSGNFYGTAEEGGAYGYGTVFKMSATGSVSALHSFNFLNGDGIYPFGSLILDKLGNLYGTAPLGGKYADGIVFKLAPNGTETILHNFTGNSDGNGPTGGLISDGKGNLYGAAGGGGISGSNCSTGCGTVFKITPSGSFKVVYAFQGGTDGSTPTAPLVRDNAGNLYGTTNSGGGASDSGTVFKISP